MMSLLASEESPCGFTANIQNNIKLHNVYNTLHTIWMMGACGSVVVKALCYKPEGHGFETRWGEFLNVPNPSGRIRPRGSLSL
jgi:hypothetical protein